MKRATDVFCNSERGGGDGGGSLKEERGNVSLYKLDRAKYLSVTGPLSSISCPGLPAIPIKLKLKGTIPSGQF